MLRQMAVVFPHKEMTMTRQKLCFAGLMLCLQLVFTMDAEAQLSEDELQA
jgi:hypothetical protein